MVLVAMELFALSLHDALPILSPSGSVTPVMVPVMAPLVVLVLVTVKAPPVGAPLAAAAAAAGQGRMPASAFKTPGPSLTVTSKVSAAAAPPAAASCSAVGLGV